MQKFKYKVKDQSGQIKKGVVEASDEKQAARVLREKGFFVIDLKPKQKSLFSDFGSGFLTKANTSDKINFTRQLSTMMTAGLPLTDALNILKNQSRPGMGRIIEDVLREVESGGNLATALEKHPEVFDKIYVALIKAGETAGVLNDVLSRLADNLEKQREFKGRVKAAMIYPAIVILGMVGVAAIMVVYVLPKISSLFEEFKINLPFTTRLLLKVSKLATSYWWLCLTLTAGLVIGSKIMLKKPAFRKYFDGFLLKLPIIGKLNREMMLTEFCRTFGLLIGAGILVVEAMEVVKASLGNLIYEQAIKKASLEVENGLPVAVALARTEVFPQILTQMITVGEETGKLDEILLKASTYFEQEADLAVKGLTSALEPLIMIVLGIGVGFLIISVIMPIYSLTSSF